MLVLNFKIDEAARFTGLYHKVGNDFVPTFVQVTAVDVRRGCVRLGLDAPKDVNITRHDHEGNCLTGADKRGLAA